jgi:hypothetical protein
MTIALNPIILAIVRNSYQCRQLGGLRAEYCEYSDKCSSHFKGLHYINTVYTKDKTSQTGIGVFSRSA